MSKSTVSLSPPTEITLPRAPPGAPPRCWLYGGFVLEPEVVRTWGERISGEEIAQRNIANYAILLVDKFVVSWGLECTGIGETWDDLVYIIVTRTREFAGWKDMDPALVPQLQEGPCEQRVREELAKIGVEHLGFQTILG